MRLLPVLFTCILAGPLLAGCLSDEPQSLTVPALAAGDFAEYYREEARTLVRLQIAGPTQVLTHDLKPMSADVLVVSGAEDPIDFFYHAGATPAVGYGMARGEQTVIYQPISESTPPTATLALLAFHGFAGRTVSVEDVALIPLMWLPNNSDRQDCRLTISKVYLEEGDRRADAKCHGDHRARFVFSEGNAFPVRVETPHEVYTLIRHVSGEAPGTAETAEEAITLVSATYGPDGPVDGDGAPFSLSSAINEVRQGFPGRPAKNCLEDKPDALLREAELLVRPDGHEWRLHWASERGACTATVDSRSDEDDLGVNDRQSSTVGALYEPDGPMESLTLATAFSLWRSVMDEAPERFRIELDAEGNIAYTIQSPGGSLELDARDRHLEHAYLKRPSDTTGP